MKQGLISFVLATIAFVLGFWFGRFPITERRWFSFWARRRAALRRDY